ncbi:MAG: [FeFe] hydrogenase H-cluster radical SAM maturase HydE [Bacteroidales bacterium]|nr:[FeFe] hydrogenase H-cluster radical SAM maturase HydE [Bacteroidales bacterium]
MENNIKQILEKDRLNKEDLITLLGTNEERAKLIYARAAEVKQQMVGNKVYFRGLVEYSNICTKNCYYCGVRSGNKKVNRYTLHEEEVLAAARFAYAHNYASMVIQSGELSSPAFVKRIGKLLTKIKKISNGELGITLSMGEQTEETYRYWRECGAHRYLLRIEASSPELYRKLHPNDKIHNYEQRIEALHLLKKTGYQVGTGVMIGLPFQRLEHLADDLIFFRDLDIDMAGMGPYIEHEDTPLYQYKDQLISKRERFTLSMKMVALLRIIMNDINIAATTAMQTLDPVGREKAIKVGANVIMPNLTPVSYRQNYLLYEDKPCIDEEASDCIECLDNRIRMYGGEVGYGEWGDSKHYYKRTGKTEVNQKE